MRILIHDYAGHPFQVQLSRELARIGHDVVHGFAGGLLTPRGDLQRRADDPAKLAFREFPMSLEYRANKYSFLKRQRYESEYGIGVSAFMREWRPEIVVSGNTPSQPQVTMAKACREVGGRFISWVQDFYGLAVDKLARKKIPVFGALAGAWYKHLDQQAFCLSRGVIVITEDFVPLVQNEGVDRARILVLPNWAPLADVSVSPRINPWGQSQGLSGGFNFIYTGTLAMKHNPDLLLQLAIAFKDVADVRLVVISEGPGADWLAAERAKHGLNNLRVLPFQPFREMSDILGTADVLLAVLEPEAGIFSVPSKVLTYHCAGRPVLAAIPAENLAARIIGRQGSGVCVDPRDTAAFLQAGRQLWENPNLRESLGKQARMYAEEHFDLKKIVPRFTEFIGRLT